MQMHTLTFNSTVFQKMTKRQTVVTGIARVVDFAKRTLADWLAIFFHTQCAILTILAGTPGWRCHGQSLLKAKTQCTKQNA